MSKNIKKCQKMSKSKKMSKNVTSIPFTSIHFLFNIQSSKCSVIYKKFQVLKQRIMALPNLYSIDPKCVSGMRISYVKQVQNCILQQKKPHSMLHNSNRLVMFLIKERNNAAVIQPFKMIELNGLQYVNEFEIQKTPSGGEY